MSTTSEHAVPSVELFKRLPATAADAEQRQHFQLQIEAFMLSALDPHAAAFKRLQASDSITRWRKECKVLRADAMKVDHTLDSLYACANAMATEFHNHPAMALHYKKAAESAEAAKEADFFIRTLAEYTYLLKTDGKLMVLTDNLRKAEITERPHHGLAYTQLRYSDAMLELANVPYVAYDEETGKEHKSNVLKAWIESDLRRDLVGITFDPSSTDRIINDQFNIWRGWAYEPVPSNADDPFWELVLDVLCDGNEEYFMFVRKWLAHMIQRPNERPLCAIGMSGPQGTGKSLFAKVVGGLMHSAHYNPNVAMKAIAGDQQGRDLEGVLLAYLDEASWGGDKLSTGSLKKAITGETDRINEKFVPAYNVPTYKRILFSSNESYYYHADPDDRRLLPLEIDASKPVRSYEFFQQIVDGEKLRPEVQQALLATLQSEDIEGWVPFVELKKLRIDTGSAMLERSMTNVQRWLFESINNRTFALAPLEAGMDPEEIAGDVISVNDLKNSYQWYCSFDSFDKTRQVNLSAREHLEFLRSVFGHRDKPVKRNARTFKGYEINWAVMQENFENQFKWKIQWDEPEQAPVRKLMGLALAA